MNDKPNPYDHVLDYMIDSNVRSIVEDLWATGRDVTNSRVVEYLGFSPKELASVRELLETRPGHRGAYLTVDGFTLRKPAAEVSP